MKATPAPRNTPAPSGLNVHDILYVLFKHKWKITLLSLLGVLAAGALAYQDSRTPSYETQAKLLVRYVVERSAADPDAPLRSKGGGGSAVMDTELQILKSFDLAIDTATRVGPAKLLPDRPKDATAVAAAGKILGSLNAGIGNDSNVIQLSYRDTEPQRAVEVLGQLIQCYFARHLEIHRSSEAFNQVAVQTDQARAALRTTEDEINRLKSESGVLSIDVTIQEFESRRQMVRETLMASQAALSEQRAKVKALGDSMAAGGHDKPAAPDEIPAPLGPQDSSRRDSVGAVAEYQDLTARLEMLRQSRNQLLLRRPVHDPAVSNLERQIAEVQSRRSELVASHPQLAAVAETKSGSAPAVVNSIDDERALEAALEAKVKTVAEQAKAVEAEVAGLSSLGFRLAGLERHRQMAEEKFRYYQSSLEKARIDETLDPTKIPNISIVQNPSAPMRSIDAKTRKLILGIAAAGIGAGLMLAFFIEWVVDRRVSRPTEIQSRLHLPLMLSIPFIRSKDSMAKILGKHDGLGLMDDSAEATFPPALAVRSHQKLMVQEREHFITPYACAIRDRIMFNFELNNITHKPKLIALTGLSGGAGTSTIAAGVARAFAETNNRKVLLVDFNPAMSGLVFPEHPAESLRRALETSREERFRRSSQNLYFAIAATRGDGKGANFLAPAALHQMMPHIEASGFDYILFDMPPVGPTSPTLSMAGFMDKILLVLDADKTNRDSLSWGFAELQRGRADVSCIFNKARSHAPRWVAGDF
jgi:succinoglycan biosynthesis transport protein ExoP